jgi:membrane protein
VSDSTAPRPRTTERPRARLPPFLPKTAPWRRRALRAIVRLALGLRLHDAPLAASAMAFNFFLSLIPLLVVLGYVVGHVVRRRGIEPVVGPLLATAPSIANDVVRKELLRMGGTSASLAPLGALGFLWLASSGTHGLMDVFELALGAPRRPWWKKRMFAIGWVLGCVAILCLSAWAIVEWDVILHADVVKRRAVLRDPAERRLVVVAMLALVLCGLAAFYRFSVEHPAGIRRRAWPGAFVALGGWLLVSWAFGAYVTELGKYALYYGSLAAVAVLLVWLWLVSLALLLGAEVNAQLEGVRE